MYRRPSSSYSTLSASLTNTRSGREVDLSARNNPQPKHLGVGARARITTRVRISVYAATSAYLRGVVRAL